MSTESSQNKESWAEIYQYLRNSDYEIAAELLNTVYLTSLKGGQMHIAIIAGAARQICRALITYHSEIEWHQLAQGNAELREQMLNRHMLSLLTLLDEPIPNNTIDTASLNRENLTDISVKTETSPKTHHSIQESLEKQLDLRMAQISSSTQERPFHNDQYSIDESKHILETQTGKSDVSSLLSKKTNAASVSGKGNSENNAGYVSQTSNRASDVKYDVNAPHKLNPPRWTVFCLGGFRVYQDDQLVEEWSGNKGLAVFKYMVNHRQHPVHKEVLMDLFWPESPPNTARNNLNVAIFSLRQAFREDRPQFSHVLFRNDHYLLNPEIDIWVDIEEFVQRYKSGEHFERAGDLRTALCEYQAAESLYKGEFLEEDRYEGWIITLRKGLRDKYLALLDRMGRHCFEQEDYESCITIFNKILTTESYREDAHRYLMICYSRQGHRHFALRQFLSCKEILAREIDIAPSPETLALYQKIRDYESI